MNGLTKEEVNYRISNNLVNYDCDVKTKSISKIILNNLFSLFNLLNFGLAFLVLITGSYKNLLFVGVVISNIIISTVQSIRSKLIIDKLSIINSSKVRVIRNNVIMELNNNEIVMDDVIIYKLGDQIITDAVILDGEVMVNESFITGESEEICYKKNGELKSGSFVVSGKCIAKVIHVGMDNYTSVITKESKKIKEINSVLMNSLNKIIKIISICIIPIGLLLFYHQYNISNLNTALLNTVAALIGMIPEGLILLTSTVLAVSVIKLSKNNVLVRDLFCIETLARVDTICLDKTGTLTTGNMKVHSVINLSNYNVDEIMGNIINNLDDDSSTFRALKKYFKKYNNYKCLDKENFSSKKKYSKVTFKEGNYILGAPEFVTQKIIKEVINNQKKYRVLLLCKDDEAIAVILLKDEIRKSAKDTINYFKKENVDVKIISGDSVNTLKGIADFLNINCKEIDVSNIEITEEIVNEYNTFGRVSPSQKKQIVELLQKKHVVAMTGDGVNDVLALKQADCSISIKDGTSMARNVSQLVLLDSSFDSVPKIIEEGRGKINNIERSSTLFLSKTGYASLIALLFIFINTSYPFEPIQLTLTNFFTIGVPSLVLALERNKEIIKGKFLFNVFSKSLPASITLVINVIIISILTKYFSHEQMSTLCVIMNAFVGFLLLYRLSYPFNKLRLSLFIILLVGFVISIMFFKDLFSLTIINGIMLLIVTCLMVISILLYYLLNKLLKKMH